MTVVIEGFRPEPPAAETPPDNPSGLALQIRCSTDQPENVLDGRRVSRADGRVDPGWIAQLDGPGVPVLRANRAFRAIAVAAGEHEVRMLYPAAELPHRPAPIGHWSADPGRARLASVLANTPPRGCQASPLRTIVHNISAPFAANMVSRVLDLGLALVMFRFLGPSGVGAYTFAVVLTGYLDILAGFGLGTLVTRDAAREPHRLADYFGNSLLARGGILGPGVCRSLADRRAARRALEISA